MSRADSRTLRLLAILAAAGAADEAARRAEHMLRASRGKQDLNVRAKAAESVGVELWQ
jgi:hypothetical protein